MYFSAGYNVGERCKPVSGNSHIVTGFSGQIERYNAGFGRCSCPDRANPGSQVDL
jgi:hypothetical protein